MMVPGPGETIPESMLATDRTSHSYLLGVAEYHRDKYKRALERIVAKAREIDAHSTATQGGLDGWNEAEAQGAARCADIALEALHTAEAS